MNKIYKFKVVLFISFACCVFPLSLNAQKIYTITVPSSKPNLSVANPGPDISDLIEEIQKYAQVQQLRRCTNAINPTLESKMKDEMGKIDEPTQYTLILDYINCKFISLSQNNNESLLLDPNWNVYNITLYPKINYPLKTSNYSTNGKWQLLIVRIEGEKISTCSDRPYTHYESFWLPHDDKFSSINNSVLAYVKEKYSKNKYFTNYYSVELNKEKYIGIVEYEWKCGGKNLTIYEGQDEASISKNAEKVVREYNQTTSGYRIVKVFNCSNEIAQLEH